MVGGWVEIPTRWDVIEGTPPVTASGITNGAGANVVPKSDGTNLVASQITDNGTTVTIITNTTITSKLLQILSTGQANYGTDQATIRVTNATTLGNTGMAAIYGAMAQGSAGSSSYGFRGTNANGTNGGVSYDGTIGAFGAWFSSTAGYTGGSNIGVAGNATGNTGNHGVVGYAATGSYAVGVVGYATGATLYNGGVFLLKAQNSTYATCALVADNGAAAAPIINGYDNGTIVFAVNDGGGMTYRREVELNVAVLASPNILTAAESGKVFHNTGATALNYHTLPTAVAGLTYTFVVTDADGTQVVAGAGDYIRIGLELSTAAGYCRSATIGDSVTLTAVDDTYWMATSVVGADWVCA